MNRMCPVCGATFGPEAVSCPDHPDERLMLVDAETNFVGQVLDGKYRLIAKLGEGGMGSVYLGVQSQIDREVAVKILRSEFKVNSTAVKRFLREARAASKLSHPNSITVYDFGQAMSGDLYIVMERLTGCSLADILDDDGPLPVERAVHILAQICDSLTEAHKLGITHRDLKPENIHIEQKAGNPDFVKVLDFGIAKMRAESDDTHKATQTGMICGTPSYMSPEQAMGRELDGRSDLYALGILLYELLTNQRPFEGDAAMEVMLKHINEPPPDIFQRTGIRVPVGIQELIEQLLAKDPVKRPPNCETVKGLLLSGLKSPVIGPIDSMEDASIPVRRREQARSSSAEKTGLAPAVSKPTTITGQARPRGAKTERGKSGRGLWLLIGLVAVGAGAIGATLAASSGEEQEAAAAIETPVDPAVLTAETAGDLPPTVEADPPEAAPNPGGAADEVPADEAEEEGDTVLELAESIVEIAEAVEVPAPEMTRFVLHADPVGAAIYEGEVLLGHAPIDFEREKNSGTFSLTFRAKGFVDRTVELATVADIETTVELERVRRATPPKVRLDGAKPGGFSTW